MSAWILATIAMGFIGASLNDTSRMLCEVNPKHCEEVVETKGIRTKNSIYTCGFKGEEFFCKKNLKPKIVVEAK